MVLMVTKALQCIYFLTQPLDSCMQSFTESKFKTNSITKKAARPAKIGSPERKLSEVRCGKHFIAISDKSKSREGSSKPKKGDL